MARMQVIGLCRFSYPAAGGFQVEHESLEARRAFLYAPGRMEDRFRHFETVSLPSLRAQTDPDFTLAIVVGEDLPDRWMTRLMDLTEDMPQAAVLPLEPGLRHRKAMQWTLNRLRGGKSAPCPQFRHDDDDAVNLRFVERLRETARDCRGLTDRHPLAAFDFNRGWVARPGPRGIEATEVTNPFWGVALGMYVGPGEERSIFNFNHYKVPEAMPTVSRNDPDMFFRGHNDWNDSRQGPTTRTAPLALLDAEGEARFRSAFAVEADRIRAAFGGGA